MRELKFRAWFEKEKRWLHGYPKLGGCSITGETIIMRAWMSEVKLEDYNAVVIEQFTGLRDNNGREIYEGDALLLTYWTNGGRSGKAKKWPTTIEWYELDARFLAIPVPGKPESYNFCFGYFDEGEVIGNIHENHELLEVEE